MVKVKLKGLPFTNWFIGASSVSSSSGSSVDIFFLLFEAS
jgi:hypothetical protein